MRKGIWIAVCSAALSGLIGCGGGDGGEGEGGSDAGKLATIEGTLSTSAARSAALVSVVTPKGSFYVEAVDESSELRDVAVNVTGPFQLRVPPGHEYMIIIGDEDGPIGAMMYGAQGQERPDFRIRSGTATVHLGVIVVDVGKRRIKAKDNPSLDRPDKPKKPDRDGDGIPDDSDDEDVEEEEGTGSGDSSAGAQLYSENGCAACHGANGAGTASYPRSIRGKPASDVAEALRGEEEDDDEDDDDERELSMPAYPLLVDSAADLAAFLAQGTQSEHGGNNGTGGNQGDPGSNGTGGDTASSGDPGGGDGMGQDPGMPGGSGIGGGTTPPGLDGAKLFAASCGVCHEGNGQGSGKIGPNLTGKAAAVIQAKLGNGHNGFSAASFAPSEIQAISAALTP